MKYNKICIIGLGLLGGSIGLGLKDKKIAGCVYGVARRQESIDQALAMGSIDEGSLDYKQGVDGADIIILATEVNTIIHYIDLLSECGLKDVIVTDVGSTKDKIVKIGQEKLDCFIGSHPMAGSEKAGLGFAQKDLFNNHLCLLTQTNSVQQEDMDKLKDFWEVLGSKVKIVPLEDHDKILAYISHLPHVVASNLVCAIDQDYIQYAAEGFFDTTRVASGSPVMWKDICGTNKENILLAIENFEKCLKEFKSKLQSNDCQTLQDYFQNAKEKRDKYINER